MPEPGENANGGENIPGPSSGIAGLADGDEEGGGNMESGKEESGNGGNAGGAGGAGGRSRLSRSLWPPGIPYHGTEGRDLIILSVLIIFNIYYIPHLYFLLTHVKKFMSQFFTF
jgi:hypothetical protein